MFISSALGTTYLYLNELDKVRKIADMTVKMISKQPDWKDASKGYPYYLRFDDDYELVKYVEPQRGVRTIYKVQGDAIRQPFFSIGYPVAFMGLCYQVFADERYLSTAEELLEYALRINKDARVNQWSHKLMWGASVIAGINNKAKYWRLVYDIANSIMENQCPHTGMVSNVIDQSAEIAFWTPIIAMNVCDRCRDSLCVDSVAAVLCVCVMYVVHRLHRQRGNSAVSISREEASSPSCKES